MYCEGFDQVYGSTTRAVTKEMAARREILYLGPHQRVNGLCARERMRIRRLLLCCGVLLAVSEDEADDELEEVAILMLKMMCSIWRRGAIGTSPALQSAAYDRSANGERGVSHFSFPEG